MTNLGKNYFNAFKDNRSMYPNAEDSTKFDAWEEDALKNYKKYNVKEQKLQNINTDGATIEIICAAWCEDTREQVSYFVKIMESLHFPKENIHYHFVDREKKAPLDTFVNQYDFTRVPTMIFYRDSAEIGSIIESPTKTLEKDILEILGVKEE